MSKVSKSCDYNRCGAKSYDYNKHDASQNLTTIIQYDAGQNPKLNYMSRTLTRTMDLLLGYYVAGQNPTQQVKENFTHVDSLSNNYVIMALLNLKNSLIPLI